MMAEETEAKVPCGEESTTKDEPAIFRQESSLAKLDTKLVEEACEVMMDKIDAYVNGELTSTSEDYKLLESLNKMTVSKYAEMSNMTKNLIKNMEEVNSKYESLHPYLIQIDMLEESVQKLEQAAYRIDAYSKELEARYKKIERK